jgi:hypothetical protein
MASSKSRSGGRTAGFRVDGPRPGTKGRAGRRGLRKRGVRPTSPYRGEIPSFRAGGGAYRLTAGPGEAVLVPDETLNSTRALFLTAARRPAYKDIHAPIV